jgi:hypothetical protein
MTLLITPRKTNRRTRPTRRLLIQRHIIRQLRLLSRQLTLTPRIALRNLDLDPPHIRLQLQHLILDLAILECRPGGGFGAAGRGDGVVEAACAGFGGLGEFGGGGDDGEVGGGDAG